jgi:hypothetical protein
VVKINDLSYASSRLSWRYFPIAKSVLLCAYLALQPTYACQAFLCLHRPHQDWGPPGSLPDSYHRCPVLHVGTHMFSESLSELDSTCLRSRSVHPVYLGCQALAMKTTPYTMRMVSVVKTTTEKNAKRTVFPVAAACGMR